MLRCMLGSVKGFKSENPKGEGEFRKWKGGVFKYTPFPFPKWKACLQLQSDVLLQRLPAYYKIQPTEWEIYIKLNYVV